RLRVGACVRAHPGPAHVRGCRDTAALRDPRGPGTLGADHVIDYTEIDYTATGERYDWIVDTDSHHSILRVRRALRPNGVYVTLGGTALPIISALVVGPVISLAGTRWTGLLLWWSPFDPDDLATIEALIVA